MGDDIEISENEIEGADESGGGSGGSDEDRAAAATKQPKAKTKSKAKPAADEWEAPDDTSQRRIRQGAKGKIALDVPHKDAGNLREFVELLHARLGEVGATLTKAQGIRFGTGPNALSVLQPGPGAADKFLTLWNNPVLQWYVSAGNGCRICWGFLQSSHDKRGCLWLKPTAGVVKSETASGSGGETKADASKPTPAAAAVLRLEEFRKAFPLETSQVLARAAVLEQSTQWLGKPLADIVVEAQRSLSVKTHGSSSGGGVGGGQFVDVMRHFHSEIRNIANTNHHETMAAASQTNRLLTQISSQLQLLINRFAPTASASSSASTDSATNASVSAATASANPFAAPLSGSSMF